MVASGAVGYNTGTMLPNIQRHATAVVAAAEALPFGVAATDPHGRITWANAAYAQLSDCTPDELLGQSAGTFDWDALAHAVPSSEPWRGYAVCKRKTGEAYSVEHSITTLRDAAADTAGFWIMKRDTTGLRRPAGTLYQAEANLSALIESTEDFIWSVDLDYRLLTFNTALRDDVLSRSAVQVAVGMRPEEWMPPERAALWPPMFARALSEGPFRIEYQVLSGRTLELSFNPIRQDGGTVGISVFGKDITERKQAEKTLQEAETTYRTIFDGALEGIFRTSVEGKALTANPALAKIFGYDSPEDFVSTITDVGHQVWLDPAERTCCLQRLENGEVVRGYECQFKRKDGRLIWGTLNIQKVCGPNETTAYYEGFIEDITERKCHEAAIQQANEAVAKTEKQYRHLFNSISDAVFVYELREDGLPLPSQYREVNDNACRLLGYSREELLQLRVTDVVPSEERSSGPANAQKLLADGQVMWTGSLVTKHGQRIPVEANTHIFDLDGKSVAISSVRDITERKKAERRYREIVDGALEGIYRTSPEGTLLAANPALADMLGYGTPNELVSAINDAAHQLWLDPTERIRCAASLEDHESVRGFVTQFKRKDGTAMWASINGRRVSGSDGQTLYYDGFVQDVTERRETGARLAVQSKRFQDIIEHTDAGYFRIGVDGRYQDVNSAWLRMHGFISRDDAIGLHFSAIQVPEDLFKAKEIVELVSRGECIRAGEFSRLKRDGTVGYHTFSANPVFDGDRVVGMEGFLVDITDRKTAEQERQKTEQRYRSLFDSMQEGVAIHRLVQTNGTPENYVLLEVNRRYEEILGVRREAVVNRPATSAYGTQDPPYLKEFASVVETGTPLQFETYFPPMDKHFVISVAPMGEDGFATIFFDNSEQKKTERAIQQANEGLAQAEAHYRLMFNCVSDAVFIHDFGVDGFPSHFTEVNENACRLLGYAREELLQMGPPDIDTPEEHPEIVARAQKVMAGGELIWEGRLVAKDGRRIPVEVNTHLVDLDGAPTIISCVRDISERKKNEESMRSLATAIEQATETIVITDLDGTIQYCNPAFEKVTGYSKKEAIGQNSRVLKSGKHSKDFYERMWATIMQGKVWSGHLTNKRKDGSFYEESATITPIRDASGEISGFVAVKRDVTERLQLENQLRQAQKLESIGRLAGGVAHDFNNLLTVINGYSGFLLKELKAGDPLRSYAEQITIAGERAASLTKQLLAFSRKQVIEPRVLDLNSIIRESSVLLRRLIGDDIVLETHLDSSLGQVMADPDQIHQVIMNLAVNARDAMPDGGALDIETLNVELGKDDSAAVHPGAIPGRYVLVTVTDSGHGMDETIRKQVFEPFFTTKGVGKGTGLGLSTVYGIIRQNGGWVDVWSEVGVGTTFKLYLPRIDACPVAERKGTIAVGAGGGETILVVEDESAVRSFAKAALRQHGYPVLGASDGDEALLVAKQFLGEIDLLVTDVVMPGLNGKELADHLRMLYPGLKVLFISGYTADVIAHRGVLDPGVAFLHKPFGQEELAQKVREVLADPIKPILES